MHLARTFVVHFLCLVLFTLLPLGSSRRRIHNGYSHYDSQQQTKTLKTALEVSTDAREAFLPVGFPKGQFRLRAAPGRAPQMRAPQGQSSSRITRADTPVMPALHPFFDRKRRSVATEPAAVQRRIADCNAMLCAHPSCRTVCRTSDAKMQKKWSGGQGGEKNWQDGQAPQVEIIAKPDTTIEFTVKGVKGEGCKALTEEIESMPSLERDAGFMGLALDEARAAAAAGEVPVGAVVVDDATGTIVARARNAIEATQDASAHAELLALRRAAAAKGNWRLANCTLYSTLEPCVLCMSACYAFRVGRVVYGAPDHRLGAAESWLNMSELGHPFHALEIDGGVREPEAADAMRSFFRERRKQPKWEPP